MSFETVPTASSHFPEPLAVTYSNSAERSPRARCLPAQACRGCMPRKTTRSAWR